MTVWDDEHLVFANIRSPRTVANLRHNPVLEINVVVLVEDTRALPLRSPAYDQPVTEAEVRARWERIYLGNDEA